MVGGGRWEVGGAPGADSLGNHFDGCMPGVSSNPKFSLIAQYWLVQGTDGD